MPIVFTQTADPVGAGFVDSLARPGGNATGFTSFEYGMATKWLELLKEIAPSVTRAAVLREPAMPQGSANGPQSKRWRQRLGVELSPVKCVSAAEIEHAITAFAERRERRPDCDRSPAANVHRDLIIALAARHRLPAVYFPRFFVTAGGLISYGPDQSIRTGVRPDMSTASSSGEKPADLPVQAPTKHELVINLKTAKALGLDVPPSVLARADEVIE